MVADISILFLMKFRYPQPEIKAFYFNRGCPSKGIYLPGLPKGAALIIKGAILSAPSDP